MFNKASLLHRRAARSALKSTFLPTKYSKESQTRMLMYGKKSPIKTIKKRISTRNTTGSFADRQWVLNVKCNGEIRLSLRRVPSLRCHRPNVNNLHTICIIVIILVFYTFKMHTLTSTFGWLQSQINFISHCHLL